MLKVKSEPRADQVTLAPAKVLRQLDGVLERRPVRLELVRLQRRQRDGLSAQHRLSEVVFALSLTARAT
jgi:hypothetical protein